MTDEEAAHIYRERRQIGEIDTRRDLVEESFLAGCQFVRDQMDKEYNAKIKKLVDDEAKKWET